MILSRYIASDCANLGTPKIPIWYKLFIYVGLTDFWWAPIDTFQNVRLPEFVKLLSIFQLPYSIESQPSQSLSKDNGILLPKLFWHTVRKKCSSDWEKLLKFEAEGQEFAKILRSLEQFIQTVKGQNNFL